MENYTELSTLNQGSYGVVQLVRHERSGKMYAAKRVSLELSSRDELDDEIAVHQRVANYPRVVQLVDHFYLPATNEYVLLLEYCSGGDLHDRIANGKRPSVAEIKRIVLQLLDAVEYCHEKGVYHRDIKPENLFLAATGTVKLGDWGLATTERFCSEFGTGSEQYMAPECFDTSAEVYDAAKADIWAVGIVLLNYMFGHNPFKQATERDPLFKDFAASRECLYDIFPTLTPNVFGVLRHTLTLNPDHRDIRKMRAALEAVKIWTTDEEAEQLEQKLQHKRDEKLRAEVVLNRSAAKMVPVVHKPFRVPSAVAQSLKYPSTPWDRRKMYTPPSSRASFWTKHSSRPVLPRHLEQPEEEAIAEEAETIGAEFTKRPVPTISKTHSRLDLRNNVTPSVVVVDIETDVDANSDMNSGVISEVSPDVTPDDSAPLSTSSSSTSPQAYPESLHGSFNESLDDSISDQIGESLGMFSMDDEPYDKTFDVNVVFAYRNRKLATYK